MKGTNNMIVFTGCGTSGRIVSTPHMSVVQSYKYVFVVLHYNILYYHLLVLTDDYYSILNIC